MNILSLIKNKFLYRLHIVAKIYDYEWIKELYQKVFISSFHRPQYYIELVNKCNADCIFCTYPIIKDLGKPLVSMNDILLDQAIAIIKQEKKSNINYFLLDFKKRRLKIPVGVDIKLLSNQKLKQKQCHEVYNKFNYSMKYVQFN